MRAGTTTSRWEYKDVYKGQSGEKVMRVIETGKGALKKTVEENGRPLTVEELKAEDARLESFVSDPAQQARQHKDTMQDDKRAESMLRMLPDAFLWKVKSEDGEGGAPGIRAEPWVYAADDGVQSVCGDGWGDRGR